jgi:S1-C subfamily serine protease
MSKRVSLFCGLFFLLCFLAFFLVSQEKKGSVSWIENQTWLYDQVSAVFSENIPYVGRIYQYKRLNPSLSSSGILIGRWSGIFVDRGGYMITNKHVVDNLQAYYDIIFPSWEHFSLLHIWIHPSLDLALLQLSGTQKQFADFPLPHFRSSQQLIPIGEVFVATTFSWTIFTWNIIANSLSYLTNTSVLPWSSGSPLWDLSGYVLGLFTATTADSSFVIPLSETFVTNWIAWVVRSGSIN